MYIGGGAIMALRQAFERLPNPLAVASRLSREVLVSLGLAEIVLPMVLVAAGYLVWALARRRPQPEEDGLVAVEAVVERDDVIMERPLVGALMVALVSVVIGVWDAIKSDTVAWWPYPEIAFVVTAGYAWALLRVRNGIIVGARPPKAVLRRVPLPNRLARSTVAMAVLWAFVALPTFVMFFAGVGFEHARICGSGGAWSRDGVLIGETDDRFYLGETDLRMITTIPLTNVQEVFIFSGEIRPEVICNVDSSTGAT
jgi:hypothetical protein